MGELGPNDNLFGLNFLQLLAFDTDSNTDTKSLEIYLHDKILFIF